MKRSALAAVIAEPPWRAEQLADAAGCSTKVMIGIMKRQPGVFYMPQREGAQGKRPRPLLSHDDALALLARIRDGGKV